LCFKKIHAGSPYRNDDVFAACSLALDTTMIPKRQAMIVRGDNQWSLIRISSVLADLKLWQRIVKLLMQFDAMKLP
jgi:hypothetical protein